MILFGWIFFIFRFFLQVFYFLCKTQVDLCEEMVFDVEQEGRDKVVFVFLWNFYIFIWERRFLWMVLHLLESLFDNDGKGNVHVWKDVKLVGHIDKKSSEDYCDWELKLS